MVPSRACSLGLLVSLTVVLSSFWDRILFCISRWHGTFCQSSWLSFLNAEFIGVEDHTQLYFLLKFPLLAKSSGTSLSSVLGKQRQADLCEVRGQHGLCSRATRATSWDPDSKINYAGWHWHLPLIPVLGRQWQVDLWVWGQLGLQSKFQDN